jgi:hypothetical protein
MPPGAGCVRTVVSASSTPTPTAGPFEHRAPSAVTLKGLGDNVLVWQVLGTSIAGSRPYGPHRRVRKSEYVVVNFEKKMDRYL